MFAERSLRATGRGRRGFDLFVFVLCVVAGGIALLPLALVLYYLVVEGTKAWSLSFLVSPPGRHHLHPLGSPQRDRRARWR